MTGQPQGPTEGAEEPAGAEDTQSQADEEAPVEEQPKTIYDEEIALGDGSKVTVGALKDAYQTKQAAERESAKRAVALDIRESEVIQTQQFWMELGEMPPQVRQKIAARLQARQAVEESKMLELMPELQDNMVKQGFRREVVATLEKYGYKPQEMNITDHRQLLILRDNIRLQKRVSELSAEPKPNLPRPKPGGRSGSPQPGKPRNQAEAVGQIAVLLR